MQAHKANRAKAAPTRIASKLTQNGQFFVIKNHQILIGIKECHRAMRHYHGTTNQEAIMSNPLMQAPVILFVAMVAVFALILGPVAVADMIRNSKSH